METSEEVKTKKNPFSLASDINVEEFMFFSKQN